MVKVVKEQQITIIDLGGKYEALNEELLQALAEKLLEQADRADPPWLLVDLTGIGYVGSNFLEILVRGWKRLKQRSGTMALCGVGSFCADILRITRLNTLWTIYPSREEALRAMATELAKGQPPS
ncbi:MAG: STAS domain-containing protein [Thermoguttaceae bacterium]|nr:STAS domain-containing protein [Thermoguttaceae bacterium]MDW8077525.1 STAS domain-containing protein [Thermoguttaceae bacterium]